VSIQQSHGGSGTQARSVIDGLEADVVTLGVPTDIDAIAAAGLTAKDWVNRLPDGGSPYTSTVVFLVRKGNPKGIKDWSDLVKPGIAVVTPNPKTSAGGRMAYLGAYGWALDNWSNDDAKARAFIGALYKNVPVLDSGARGATVTFGQRGVGDVLLAWENEAFLALKESGADKYEIVVPPESVLAEPAVAVIDQVVDQKGTRKAAEAYLRYLYSDEGQLGEGAEDTFLRRRCIRSGLQTWLTPRDLARKRRNLLHLGSSREIVRLGRRRKRQGLRGMAHFLLTPLFAYNVQC
jgi:sulfate transport system substrate-binding protein